MEIIDDLNFAILEGIIMGNSELATLNEGKFALNFIVENTRNSGHKETGYTYNVVAWGKIALKYVDILKDGTFVRITGHLQREVVVLQNGKTYYCSKLCADKIDVAENEF